MSTATATAATSFRVLLEPLSELLFRDGRPLEAGFIHQGQLPTPQTIAGAFRSNLFRYFSGKSPEVLGDEIRKDPIDDTESAFAKAIKELLPNHAWIAGVRFRGPWLVRSYPASWRRQSELMLPTPVTVHRTKNGSRYGLLEPAQGLPKFLCEARDDASTTGDASEPGGANSMLWTRFSEDSEPVGGYITAGAMSRMLQRYENVELFEDFANQPSHVAWHVDRSDLVTDVPATHIRRTLGPNVAEEGMIFSPCSTAFHGPIDQYGVACPTTSIMIEMVLPASANARASVELRDFIEKVGRIPLGGRGKEVRVRLSPDDEVAYPTELPLTPETAARIALIATSPVVTANPMSPEFMSGDLSRAYSLLTIAAGQPECYSGWDAARRSPRPTVHALPAGTIFFLEVKKGGDVAAGLKSLENLLSLSPAPFADLGWGTFLVGRWEPVLTGRIINVASKSETVVEIA